MTIREAVLKSKDGRQYVKYGIAAKYYSTMAKIFKQDKYWFKAGECLDKRWEMMLKVIRQNNSDRAL